MPKAAGMAASLAAAAPAMAPGTAGPARVPLAYAAPPRPAWLPLFGHAHVAIFLLMAAMMISLVNTGAVLSWRLPPDIPVWAGALILLIACHYPLPG